MVHSLAVSILMILNKGSSGLHYFIAQEEQLQEEEEGEERVGERREKGEEGKKVRSSNRGRGCMWPIKPYIYIYIHTLPLERKIADTCIENISVNNIQL